MKLSLTLKSSVMAVALAACSASEQEPASGWAVRYLRDPDTGITLAEGFDADLVYEVPESQGSWVAMDFDDRGRLLVSDQDDAGIFRVTLPELGAAAGAVEVEPLEGFPREPVAWGRRTVFGALGFLYAFDSLYMSTMKGFYRVRDTDGDDQFDEFTLLKKLYPGWEHSAPHREDARLLQQGTDLAPDRLPRQELLPAAAQASSPTFVLGSCVVRRHSIRANPRVLPSLNP